MPGRRPRKLTTAREAAANPRAPCCVFYTPFCRSGGERLASRVGRRLHLKPHAIRSAVYYDKKEKEEADVDENDGEDEDDGEEDKED